MYIRHGGRITESREVSTISIGVLKFLTHASHPNASSIHETEDTPSYFQIRLHALSTLQVGLYRHTTYSSTVMPLCDAC